jgi:hypothetical protein
MAKEIQNQSETDNVCERPKAQSHSNIPGDKDERLSRINRELEIFQGSHLDPAFIEIARSKEYLAKVNQMQKAGIRLSEESQALLRQMMTDEAQEQAVMMNERFDLLRIEKTILENVGRNDSILMKRLFPDNPAGAGEDVFWQTLTKLERDKNTEIPVWERIQIFRKALEYFAHDEKLKYPIGHGTGSDALRLIIEEGKMKQGGSGEHGEGTGSARGGKQLGVSVAEMHHPMADYVGMFYAMMAANKEISRKELRISSEKIDGKTIANDFKDISINFFPTEMIVSTLARKLNKDDKLIRSEIAREAGKDESGITREDVLNSKILNNFFNHTIDRMENRTHYRTAETEELNYLTYSELLRELEAGEFPKVELAGKVYQDPQEIIGLNYNIDSASTVQEKKFMEMLGEYKYWLKVVMTKKRKFGSSPNTRLKNCGKIKKE